MSTESLLSAIAWVGLMAMAPSAQAQTRKVAGIVVAIDRRLDAEAVAAGTALQRLLHSDSRCESVDLAALAQGNARDQRAKAGSALLAEALRQLDEMKDKPALWKAADAIAAYEEADLTRDFPGLLDSIAARAFALSSAGDKEGMKAELVRLNTLKADYQLDASRASPDIAPLVAQARAEVRSAGRATLEVSSEPVPAEIFVDGIYRGIGAVSVPDLAPGLHYLTLRALGYELAQQGVRVGLGKPVVVSLKPAAGERGLLELIRSVKASSQPGADGSGGELAKWAGAQEALVVALRRRGEGTWAQAILYAADGRRLAAAEGALKQPEAIEELAREVLFGDSGALVKTNVAALTSARAESPPSSEVDAESRHRARRTLAVALGGGGIAAVGAGVVFGVLGKKEYQKAKELQGGPDAAKLEAARTTAIRERALANIGYGVGAVAVGVGLYFAITSDLLSGNQEPRLSVAPMLGGGALVLAGGF